MEKLFEGFFKNPNYNDLELLTINNNQTQPNEELLKYSDFVNDNKDFSTLKEIYTFIKDTFKDGDSKKFETSSTDIINSKILDGCTEYGLIFTTLLRLKGIPTVFVKSARRDWIKDLIEGKRESNYVRGHIFLEVYIKGHWYLIDSALGKLYINYDKENFSLPSGYYVFSKSLDSWESGSNNLKNNYDIMKKCFKDFDLNLYKEPDYEKYDLLDDKVLTLLSGKHK